VMSPARQHFIRTMAARHDASDPMDRMAARSSSEKMQAQLRLHTSVLKTKQSRMAKTAAKAEFLPAYTDYVDGVLSGGRGAQDDVLAMVMLWRLDTGDLEGALQIADYAVRHDLSMPPGFTRNLPTTLLEQMADVALERPDPDPLHAAPLDRALLLTQEADMPDEVRAKAHKALGLAFMDGNPVKAMDHFEAALALHPKCGVRSHLARLRRHSVAADEGT